MKEGAMMPGEKGKPVDVFQLLGEALDMELVCVLRYKRQYVRAAQISSESVQVKFLQYADEEQTHARHIMQRIIELGENPNLYQAGALSQRHNMSVERQSFMDMLIDDVIAARIAIDTYQKLLVCVGTDDSTTRQLVDGILADKQKQAEERLRCIREVVERAVAELDQPPFSGKRWSAAAAAP